MKNYYKILQIDKDASPEIIKVAYKLLVKKNHPDLKEGEEKKVAEENIKEINEAYDVLSNSTSKSEYDLKLNNNVISDEKYQTILNENINLKKQLNFFKNYYTRNESKNVNYQELNRNMYDNNIHNNTSANNNLLYRFIKNTNESTKNIIAFFITFLIIFIAIKIPFIRNLMISFFSSGYLLIILCVLLFYFFYFINNKK